MDGLSKAREHIGRALGTLYLGASSDQHVARIYAKLESALVLLEKVGIHSATHKHGPPFDDPPGQRIGGCCKQFLDPGSSLLGPPERPQYDDMDDVSSLFGGRGSFDRALESLTIPDSPPSPGYHRLPPRDGPQPLFNQTFPQRERRARMPPLPRRQPQLPAVPPPQAPPQVRPQMPDRCQALRHWY